MPKRIAVAVLVMGVLAAACGGNAKPPAVTRDKPSGTTRVLDLPDPVVAVPAFRIDILKGDLPRLTRRVEAIKGVAVVADVTVRAARVTGPAGQSARLRIAGVQPLAFRAIAPPSTRDADFVWNGLMAGQAAVSFEAATKLGIEGNASVAIDGRRTVVGAYADNGTPNLADVLVPDHLADKIGAAGRSTLLVGARPSASHDRIRKGLDRALRGAKTKVYRLRPHTPTRQQPAGVPQAVGQSQGSVIGTMNFRILRNGYIDPDPAWVSANIVSASVPVLGTVTCHRVMVPQLHAALQEIVDAGLTEQVRTDDYGGCYVPRFISRDPKNPLSMHAFGLAIDLNVSSNHYETRGDMDPRIVEIFERWGFAWGGRWSPPDPMHFELARLMRV